MFSSPGVDGVSLFEFYYLCTELFVGICVDVVQRMHGIIEFSEQFRGLVVTNCQFCERKSLGRVHPSAEPRPYEAAIR